MTARSRFFTFAGALLAATALFACLPTSALASGGIPTGWVGTDISWPQCGVIDGSQMSYNFSIVGVNGGTPFTSNPCFGDQFAWARNNGLSQLYINLDYGQRSSGPLKCLADDAGCQSYNYGYDAAQWAVQFADQQSQGNAHRVGAWWLDIETGNNWSGNTDLNDYVIQGAIDYFQITMGVTVGVYSTSYQWGQIAGNFAPPNVPNWVPGSYRLDDWEQCSASIWPGGQVWFIQWLNPILDLDQNAGC